MQRAQNSTTTPNATTASETQEIAPTKRGYDRSAYKLFPDPPNATVHTPLTTRTPPPTQPIVNRARRSVSLNEFSKSSMLPGSPLNQAAGSGAGWNASPPKKVEGRAGVEEQRDAGVNGANTISGNQQQQLSSSPGPHGTGRERSSSVPYAQKPVVNNRSSPPMSTRASPPNQRYYANAQNAGETGDAAPAQFQSRVAQVQKLLAAGIKPPPLVTESSGHSRTSSSSGRDPVGLGLSFGSNATTPDLAMFPAPGKPGAFISRPQSPGSYSSSGPRSPNDSAMSRPMSPNGYGMSRPQSPGLHSRPHSPSRIPYGRPQSPFSQPPPRPHSPNGFQPRQGSPLSGNTSRPQSPRTASPMLQPGRPGQPRMAPHDLRVDTSMSAQRPVQHPSANHRQLYQHQRQNTEYRKQLQGVQPLQETESIPNMPQPLNDRQSPPQTQQSDHIGRSSPPKPHHTPPPQQQQQQQQQQPPPPPQETSVPESKATLRPPGDDRQKRKMIRKSRLQKPLPPPPPPDSLLPPGPVLDPATDTSRDSSRPDSPVSTTSSTSPVSPVSPMFSQGYGYSAVAANAPSLPSPVSAIANFDIQLPFDAPDVPPIPEAMLKDQIPVKSTATTRPSSPHSPPLSPPSSKFQAKMSSPKVVVSPRRSPSPVETPSPSSAASSDDPDPSDSPVRFEKASSMQIQPLERPVFDGMYGDDSSRVSSIKSGVESIQDILSSHRRVGSLAPSLIELKPSSDAKRREFSTKESTPESTSAVVKNANDLPAEKVVETAESNRVVAEPALNNGPVPALPKEPEVVRKQDITKAPLQVEEAKPNSTQSTPAPLALRSKSSRARDLISKIEQKVQSNNSQLDAGLRGRITPNGTSPTPSIKSRGPTPKVSQDNLAVSKNQSRTASQSPRPHDDAIAGTSVAVHSKPTDTASKPQSQNHADEASKQDTPEMAAQSQITPPQTTVNVVEPTKPRANGTQDTVMSTQPPSASSEQTASTSAKQNTSRITQNHEPSKGDSTTAKPLTSAAKLLAAAQQHMKAVQALGQQHIPSAKQTASEKVVGSQTTTSSDESALKPSPAPQKAELPKDVSVATAPQTAELPKSAPVATAPQRTEASNEVIRRDPSGSATKVAKPVRVSDVVTSPHGRSDSVSSYKSFFMQEDIFYSDAETPTTGSGALPIIEEDGLQEEPEGRDSSSIKQSIPAKIPARPLTRDDRSASKHTTVQSSSSSILSSHWSKYDDAITGSSASELPRPGIAPFARADRPSSADTGVLPADENIKISTMPYEMQNGSKTSAESTQQKSPNSISHQRTNSIPRAQPAEVEKLDVVRPTTAPQPRPVSAAPPPVPRKDTIRRPVPKRAQNSDPKNTVLGKTAGSADKQRENTPEDVTRNKSQGSVSSINLDAIRARVAGLSERTAKAIEAPSKDDISLLTTLEDLAKQSEALHERYANLRGERQRLTNNMSSILRDVRPGPGYVTALMNENAALAAVMSAMDICFAKLKSLDCRKEEAIAGLMANVHREPSISGRARGMSTSQLKQTLLLSREPSNATIVSDLAKQDKSKSKSPQPTQPKVGSQQAPHSSSSTPSLASTSTTPRPKQGPTDSRSASQQDVSAQNQNRPESPQRTRVQGLKAAKILGLMNKQGQATERDITLPDATDGADSSSRLMVNIGQLRQAKTPPPQRPLPTPPARSTSAINSMHASVMSVASTPEDPDLWTPHEDDDDNTPNVLKGPGPPGRDVRVYAEDDFLDYYRNAH